MPRALAWLRTFAFVNVAWVFFRAKDMTSATKVLSGMTQLDGMTFPASGGLHEMRVGLLIMLAFVVVLATKPTVEQFVGRNRYLGVSSASGVMFGVALLAMFLATSRSSEFLYFNF
jgi:hypothetical protein